MRNSGLPWQPQEAISIKKKILVSYLLDISRKPVRSYLSQRSDPIGKKKERKSAFFIFKDEYP